MSASMKYSICYQPNRSRKKPWVLRIWEPAPQPGREEKRTRCYLFNAQYRFRSQTEAQILLAEFLQGNEEMAI